MKIGNGRVGRKDENGIKMIESVKNKNRKIGCVNEVR